MTTLRSYPLLLAIAALSAACGARSLPAGAPGEVIVPSLPQAPEAKIEEAVAPSPAPRANAGMPAGTWSGVCKRQGVWIDVDATLTFSSDGSSLQVNGDLAFADRKTIAKLEGPLVGDRYELRGTMTEVEGLGTTWNLELSIDAARSDRDTVRGAFREVTRSGAEPMCSFVWPRTLRKVR